MTQSATEAKRLERNREHQKYFLAGGVQVTGASTIAKLGHDNGALMGWAAKNGPGFRNILKKAGIVGTVAHFLIQCYIEDCQADLSEFSEAEIEEAYVPYRKFLAWWKEQDMEVVHSEVQLVSEKYGYGGTIDVIARDSGGRLILIDWKTSSGIWPDHLCQLAAYENLVHENMQEQVFKRVIVRGGKADDEGDFEQRWVVSTEKYFTVFKAQLALYNAMKGIK